jgi:hypothetical protein
VAPGGQGSAKPPKRPRPWESEQAAFGFLLRVVAVFGVLIALILIAKAIF